MIKSLRGWLRGLVAVAIVVAFSSVAFSPGTVLAVEKAKAWTASALYLTLDHQLAPVSVGPVVASGKKKPPKYDEPTKSDSSVVARVDGYMNWRMHDTTRSV